ncbi:hypothetical protein FNY66_08495 [Mediterraneibacter catenae]|uniref:FtsW/RodA/SpoVE family cell cycle protein n=1 Tax=Mediterraneibacter catenae TaxID=2594882 RepID=A0A5M9I0P6_9FIRM|nr:FtsW/RodA/SpoVE family cell cycle protein [Mediterraneibacter catenae]KAA8501376.1 hypothetical protein FNY66_08495 [Mediterraneibacter catenae]
MNKEEYIKTLTDQIRCKMARPEVAREIEDHIEDQTRAFMSEGMNRQEAESAALKDMGNPVDAGVELDKVHRPAMPWGMIALIIVLSVAGYVFQYILNSRNIEAGGDGFFVSQRQIWFTVFGILVMIAVCFADYTRIAARARELMIGITVLIVLGGQFFSLNINGSRQWIGIPGGWVVTIPLVLMLTVYRRWYRLRRKAVLAGIGAFVVGLPLVTACYYWFFGADYQRERLLFYLSPAVGWDKQPQEVVSNGIEYVRAILGNSSLIGRGNGVPDIADMPELSEYLLAGVAGYYGILAAVLLAGLLLFLLFRFLRISLRQRNQLGMLMGAGCSAAFLIEVGGYLLNNFGIMYMGNYCPFLTYGGTGTMVTYVLMGIMLSICRYQNTAPERRTTGSLFGIRRPAEKMKD